MKDMKKHEREEKMIWKGKCDSFRGRIVYEEMTTRSDPNQGI